jgi:hypothetical protein
MPLRIPIETIDTSVQFQSMHKPEKNQNMMRECNQKHEKEEFYENKMTLGDILAVIWPSVAPFFIYLLRFLNLKRNASSTKCQENNKTQEAFPSNLMD